MRTILLVVMAYLPLTLPAFAEEQMTYTDEHLEKYDRYSTYDEETVFRSEADLRGWEGEKENEERLSAKENDAENKRLTKEKKTEGSVSQETTKKPDKNTKIFKKGKT